MKAKLYTVKGIAKTDIVLPKEYNEKLSSSLLKQAVRVFEDRTHFGLSKVKTRSEVNITKKKIYKQKGTGGARHGAKSAHIFVGGGVVHGPTGEKRNLNLPNKMKRVALLMALSKKFKENKAVLVEDLSKVNKTKLANDIITKIRKELKVNSKILVVLSVKNSKNSVFFKNIKNCEVTNFSSLNAFLVLRKSLIIIDSLNFEKQK